MPLSRPSRRRSRGTARLRMSRAAGGRRRRRRARSCSPCTATKSRSRSRPRGGRAAGRRAARRRRGCAATLAALRPFPRGTSSRIPSSVACRCAGSTWAISWQRRPAYAARVSHERIGSGAERDQDVALVQRAGVRVDLAPGRRLHVEERVDVQVPRLDGPAGEAAEQLVIVRVRAGFVIAQLGEPTQTRRA